MDLMEQKVKHLEIIQSVISRLANNSFLIKGWSIGLASALYGFAVQTGNWAVAGVAVIAVAMLWLLDAYYLHREILFRKLYNLVRRPDSTIELFSLCYKDAASGSDKSVMGVALTFTQYGLHLPLLVLGLGLSIFLGLQC